MQNLDEGGGGNLAMGHVACKAFLESIHLSRIDKKIFVTIGRDL